METYTQFASRHPGCFFWSCDAGPEWGYDEQWECDRPTGRRLLDVLVYESQEDMDRDADNSLAIDRATVVDDGLSTAID